MVGLLVGTATAFFIKLLTSMSDSVGSMPWYFLLLPLAMFATIWLNHSVSPESEGHGTEKVIEAIHRRAGRIDPKVIPTKLLTTVLTVATGGSVGKEGPCAQIGAGLASLFATVFRFSDNARRKLIVCGVSAGFAAVFGTPIAGSLFGVEVLAVGQPRYEVLYPSFVAGIIGYQTATFMGVQYFHHPVRFTTQFNSPIFLEIVLAGILFGLCSFAFIEILALIHAAARRIRVWAPLKGLIGGLLVLSTLLVSNQYLGLGIDVIEDTLTGQVVATWFDPVMKMLATGLTLEFGGSGGIITPIMFIGSTFGSWLGQLMHLNPAAFAALGMVALLSGCTNTPIAASIMAIEVFGPGIGLYAGMVCMISFVMTGHRSVYPSQILSIRKSESLVVELGHSLEATGHTTYRKFKP